MAFIRYHKFLFMLGSLFVGLAVLVMAGATVSIDEFGVVAVRGNNSAEDLISGLISRITHLGDSVTLGILAVATVGILYWKKERVAAHWFLLAASGSFIITAIAKKAFGRDRPEVVEQFVSASSASFPSGHTLRSAVIYALLAYLIAQTRPNKNNGIIYVVAATVILVNGASRIYLGVHWPTDVLGAWIIASFWLLLCKNGYEKSCEKRDAALN